MCKDVGARLHATIVLNHPVQKQLSLDLDIISVILVIALPDVVELQ